MQDSDDYFGDDLVLDEQTLAALDQEERKFAQQQTQVAPVARAPAPPAAKRQKIPQGWKPGIGNRTISLDDMDDLPEISVRADGTYGLRKDESIADISRKPVSATSLMRVAAESRGVPAQVPRPSSSHARPPPQAPASLSRAQSYNSQRPVSQRPHNSQYVAQKTTVAGQFTRSTSTSSIQGARGQPSGFPSSQAASNTRHMEIQMELLRKEMEDLKRENDKAQNALREAMEVKWAKEGEVSILRKGIEKTAHDHASQLARLKAAKEEADAKQAQIQKEMRDEMERLRTQFTFKQHELEMSARKPPWTNRSNRIGRDVPATPLPVPSQIRGWNNTQQPVAGPSKLSMETPHPAPTQLLVPDTPQGALQNRRAKDEPPKLPGFYNSFARAPASPTRIAAASKGKGREDGVMRPPFSSSGGALPPSPPSSPTRRFLRTQDFDVHMEDDLLPGPFDSQFPNVDVAGAASSLQNVALVERRGETEEPEFNPLDTRGQLNCILLTTVSPRNVTATLSALLRVVLPDSLPPALVSTYQAAVSRMLGMLAGTAPYGAWGAAVDAVGWAFAGMAHVLSKAEMIFSLADLLHLARSLMFSFPAIGALFVALREDDAISPDAPPSLLATLCALIRGTLAPALAKGPDEAMQALAHEMVDALAVMVWVAPEELDEMLAVIPRTPGVLEYLLHPSHPSRLLGQSIRVLAFLAVRPGLYRHLLAFPDEEENQQGEGTEGSKRKESTRDLRSLPHIERLCAILMDSSWLSDEALLAAKDTALTFLATLSLAHADALAPLQDARSVLPALIVWSAQLASALWEDEERVMASPALLDATVHSLSRTFFLLHHLVFPSSSASGAPAVALRAKLHGASARRFNGLAHMFAVTAARVGFADAPEWVVDAREGEGGAGAQAGSKRGDEREGEDEGRTGEGRAEVLEACAEMARDLLELVAEGPEIDSLWAAYQEDGAGSPEEASMDVEEAGGGAPDGDLGPR